MCKRLIMRLMMVSGLLFVAIGAMAWWAHGQTKKVPDFYQRAIRTREPERVVQSRKRLEEHVEQLKNDAIKLGYWEAAFAAEQINAWLIEQLPKRFPTLRAKGLQEPRIMIEDGVLMAAARFKDHRIDAVLSCELSVQLTDQPNRLAVSIERIRVGALPLPLGQFQERIKRIASRTSLNLQWDTRDGDTVALIDVPSEFPGYMGDAIAIESIELSEQQLKIVGRTGALESYAFDPRGPLYRIALSKSDVPADAESIVRKVHSAGADGKTLTD